jgi:hypothetical protein
MFCEQGRLRCNDFKGKEAHYLTLFLQPAKHAKYAKEKNLLFAIFRVFRGENVGTEGKENRSNS